MLATRTLDVSPASISTAIRIFPLQSVITFDGTTILAGDSAGQLHSWANGR